MAAFLLIALAAVLAVISAFISAVETALFSLRPFQIRRLHTKNPRLATALEGLMENPRRLLAAILLADALTNLPLIILSIYLLREVLPAFVPFWLMAVGIFALIVLLCDLGPKLLALAQPYRIAKAGVAALAAGMPAIDPALRFLQNLDEKIADRFSPAKRAVKSALSEDELETLVQRGAEEGAFQASESGMIREIIKLAGRTVKDCMTPRIEMFAIPDDLSNEEAASKLKTMRHRRVPVYADNPDNILGILDAKTFLSNPAIPYGEVMVPPSYVPETMGALDLLRSFLTHRQGMAVIVDEYGGTEGVITLSDMLEEILGGAASSGERDLLVEWLGEGRLIAGGALRLDDLAELGFPLERPGIDTIGGLVFNHLGTLPKPGAVIYIDGIELTVRRVSRKRVEEVMLSRKTGGGPEEERA